MNSHRLAALGQLAEVSTGQAAPQDDSVFGTIGFPFVRAGHLEELCSSHCIENDLPKISDSDAKRFRLRLFPAGTVVFAKSGMSATKDRVFQLKAPAYLVSHLAAIIAGDELDSSYLARFLSNYPPSRLINDPSYPSIRTSDVCKISIPVLPLSEQRRIATILDKTDAIRRKRRQAIDLMNDFLRSVFLEMFGDPTRSLGTWPIVRMEEVAKIERGKFTPRPRNDPSYYNGKYPFIQTGDITNSKGRLRNWTQTLNEKGTKVSKSFPPGSIVIAIVGATIGMTAILEVEVFCPDSVVGIMVEEQKVTKEYLEFLLRFWRPIFLAQAPATARANINLDTLRPLQIPLPPIQLQRKFTAVCQRVNRLLGTQDSAKISADSLLNSLSQQLFAAPINCGECQ